MTQQIVNILKDQKAALIEKFLLDVAELDAGIASFGGGPLQHVNLSVVPPSGVDTAQIAEQIRTEQAQRFTPEEQALEPGEIRHTSLFDQNGPIVTPAEPPLPPAPSEVYDQGGDLPPTQYVAVGVQPGEVVDKVTGEIVPAEAWNQGEPAPEPKKGGRRTHAEMAQDAGVSLEDVKAWAGDRKISKPVIEEYAAAAKAHAAAQQPAAAPQAPQQAPAAPPVQQQAPQAAQQPAGPQFGGVAQQPVQQAPQLQGPPPGFGAGQPQFQQPVAQQAPQPQVQQQGDTPQNLPQLQGQPQFQGQPVQQFATEPFGSANGQPY